jgi:hypothetical protein
MNSTFETVSIDSRGNSAGVSRAAAAARAWCWRLGRAIWRGLQAHGERRALRELRFMGFRLEPLDQYKPAKLANQARDDAGREAAAVRQLAYRHVQTNPGFAADLFAAADRQERMACEDRAVPLARSS